MGTAELLVTRKGAILGGGGIAAALLSRLLAACGETHVSAEAGEAPG